MEKIGGCGALGGLMVAVALAGCEPPAPRPSAVPATAVADYEWKAGGTHWKWARTLPHGCVRWDAVEDYATVSFSSDDKPCQAGAHNLDAAGHRIFYRTFEDAVIFGGTADQIGGERCPFSVSDQEKAEVLRLIQDALMVSETDAERAVLRRINERVLKADGNALTTEAGGGCNDLAIDDYRRPRTSKIDAWR